MQIPGLQNGCSLDHQSRKREGRQKIIQSAFGQYFEIVKTVFVDAIKLHEIIDDKDKLFDEIVEHFQLPADQILIIGDRALRDVRYATRNGHPSIWVQCGKFAHELPNDQTGQPTYTVKSLLEIMKII